MFFPARLVRLVPSPERERMPPSAVENSQARGVEQIQRATQAQENKLLREVEATNQFFKEFPEFLTNIDTALLALRPDDMSRADEKLYDPKIISLGSQLKMDLRELVTKAIREHGGYNANTKNAIKEEVLKIQQTRNVYLNNLSNRFPPGGKLDLRDLDLTCANEQEKKIVGNLSFYARLKEVTNPIDPQRDPATVKKVQAVTGDYLLQAAKAAYEARDGKDQLPAGAGENFGKMFRKIQCDLIGNGYFTGKGEEKKYVPGHLTKDEFDQVWKKIQQDENVKKVLAADEGKGGDLVDKGLEKDETALYAEHKKSWELINEVEQDIKNNPYGFTLKKYSDLFSIFLYAADKVFIGSIAINALFAGGNPVKMMQNPVLLALAAGSGLVANYYYPALFEGKTTAEKGAKENLQTQLETLSPKSPVRAWLAGISSYDLTGNTTWGAVTKSGSGHGALGTFLKEKISKGEAMISSEEIVTQKLLPLDTLATIDLQKNSIAKDSDEARQLFDLLVRCQQQNVDPKKELR